MTQTCRQQRQQQLLAKLCRAVGPALGAFGVADSISDPELELFSGSTWLDRNDNWGGGAALHAACSGSEGCGQASPEADTRHHDPTCLRNN